MRSEDELTKHGIKHVGMGGGKGEEFKTQDGRNGNGVGGDMNGGGTDSLEETGMQDAVHDLNSVWERRSFEF